MCGVGWDVRVCVEVKGHVSGRTVQSYWEVTGHAFVLSLCPNTEA
jgi:hypothetical protein